jgi:hypothetical protein
LLDRKNTPLEATIAGLRLRGSESAATVRRPPFFGVSSANAMAGSAVEASSRVVPLRTPRLEILKSCMLSIFLSIRVGGAGPAATGKAAAVRLQRRLWKALVRKPKKDFAGRASIGKFWTQAMIMTL